MNKPAIAATLAVLLSISPSPAIAQNAPTDTPAVSGGDLGCAVRFMFMGMTLDKAAQDTTKSESARTEARIAAADARRDQAYFLARLELTPTKTDRAEEGLAIFSGFLKLSTDEMIKEIDLCREFSRQHQAQVLQTLKKKEAK